MSRVSTRPPLTEGICSYPHVVQEEIREYSELVCARAMAWAIWASWSNTSRDLLPGDAYFANASRCSRSNSAGETAGVQQQLRFLDLRGRTSATGCGYAAQAFIQMLLRYLPFLHRT